MSTILSHTIEKIIQKYSIQVAGFLCLSIVTLVPTIRAAEPDLEPVIVEVARMQQPVTSIAGAVTRLSVGAIRFT
jgi:hypothetical protein